MVGVTRGSRGPQYKPPRDHANGLYMLPLPPSEVPVLRRLIELIVAEATTLTPRSSDGHTKLLNLWKPLAGLGGEQ